MKSPSQSTSRSGSESGKSNRSKTLSLQARVELFSSSDILALRVEGATQFIRSREAGSNPRFVKSAPLVARPAEHFQLYQASCPQGSRRQAIDTVCSLCAAPTLISSPKMRLYNFLSRNIR